MNQLTLKGQNWFEEGYRPGVIPSQSGVPPVSPFRTVPDFTPQDQYAGVVSTHALQQFEAYEYALEQMGFDENPVQFTCNWAWIPATLFTADNNGWRQG